MKYAALLLACALWGVNAYPYHYYGSNMDTLSYGSNDNAHGGMVLSRFYNPYYNQRTPSGGGMAAFMFKPEEQSQPQTSQYYLPDRRRQTTPEAYAPPQQNEVYYPQAPEKPFATEPTELADPLPTEKVEVPTTVKAVAVPELTEPEIEEVEEPKEVKELAPAPKKRVTKKKQVKRPVDDDDEEEDYPPRMPNGAFFPMFFGWGGGRSSGGAPNGATAIANAFSTGRGGVATSHATAYGPPRPEPKLQ
ncbi:WASH complex subunit 2 [Battus philenor]|uniref:WASH complex subunit 2 n=1 Tax=Battus philenor TaxID=42288 RepID=UPI0035CFE3DA